MNILPHFDTNCQIRTYPDLSAFCLKEHLDLPLRLWYLLRQEHPGACGWLDVADVYKLSCGSRRETKRWMRRGQGIFWHRCGNRLYLHSLAKVSKALDVKPKKRPVAIPADNIKNLAKFRAALFASWLTGAPRTMSQALLGEIFGRQERTIWRWCILAGVNVQKNTVWSKLPSEEALKKVYPTGVMAGLGMKAPEEETAKTAKITHWLECWTQYPYKKSWQYEKGKKPALVRQFVNTYSVEMKRGPKTRLQRQAARGVKGAKAPSHTLEDIPARAPVKGRILHPRFPFIEDKQVYRARLLKRRRSIDRSLQQNGFAYVQGQALHHGAVMWEFQTLA